jgi:hypothetical protein
MPPEAARAGLAGAGGHGGHGAEGVGDGRSGGGHPGSHTH